MINDLEKILNELDTVEKVSHQEVSKFIKQLKHALFPQIYNYDVLTNTIYDDIHKTMNTILYKISKIYNIGLAEELINKFIDSFGLVKQTLLTDLQAILEGDPAAKSLIEVILAYPGFHAILIYRLAHQLNMLEIPLLPRMLTEIAHSKTGIDINPAAKIGKYFFIDHGTGIVIGETAEIGCHVKIYQGVTIGALSLSKGHKLKGLKRHPTIGNNVTIYAGASILGGETIIGDNVTIGSNVFIVQSIDPGVIVTLKNQEVVYHNKKSVIIDNSGCFNN